MCFYGICVVSCEIPITYWLNIDAAGASWTVWQRKWLNLCPVSLKNLIKSWQKHLVKKVSDIFKHTDCTYGCACKPGSSFTRHNPCRQTAMAMSKSSLNKNIFLHCFGKIYSINIFLNWPNFWQTQFFFILAVFQNKLDQHLMAFSRLSLDLFLFYYYYLINYY